MKQPPHKLTSFAPIGPIAILKDLKRIGCLGYYHLLLAHDVLANKDAYYELFQDQTMRQAFIILDNSTIELEHPIGRYDLEQAADLVSADVICIPDKLMNSIETIRMFNAYFQDDEELPDQLYDYMAIPQGETIEAFGACVETMWKSGHRFDYWGVPRAIANEFGSRKTAINSITAIDTRDVANIHLLGMSKNYKDDIECCRDIRVMGIDSANPLVMGQQDKWLLRDYEHMDRGDYWQDTKVTRTTINNIIQLRSLIA